MSNIQIILNERIDGPTVAAAIAASVPYEIEVVNNYMPGAVPEVIDLTAVASTLKDDILSTLDAATFIDEDGALIWKVVKDGKTFNLESSYVRDAVATTGTLTDLTIGTPLIMRCEIPGFSSNTVVEISLWYGGDFLTADKDLLKDIGIVLTGDGYEFGFRNAIDCKLSFRKPDLSTDVYVIDFPAVDEVIPMEV